MKIYYLYPQIRVPDDLSLILIIYHFYQIFGPYLSLNFVKFLLSITLTFCIGK